MCQKARGVQMFISYKEIEQLNSMVRSGELAPALATLRKSISATNYRGTPVVSLQQFGVGLSIAKAAIKINERELSRDAASLIFLSTPNSPIKKYQADGLIALVSMDYGLAVELLEKCWQRLLLDDFARVANLMLDKAIKKKDTKTLEALAQCSAQSANSSKQFEFCLNLAGKLALNNHSQLALNLLDSIAQKIPGTQSERYISMAMGLIENAGPTGQDTLRAMALMVELQKPGYTTIIERELDLVRDKQTLFERLGAARRVCEMGFPKASRAFAAEIMNKAYLFVSQIGRAHV